jgi:hypothetical protein
MAAATPLASRLMSLTEAAARPIGFPSFFIADSISLETL